MSKRELSLSESGLNNAELFTKGFNFVSSANYIDVTPAITCCPESKDRQYLEAFDGLHTNGIGTSLLMDVPGTLQALPFILGFMLKKGFDYLVIGTSANVRGGYVPSITTTISFYDVDPEAIGLEGYDLDPDQLEVFLAKVEEAVYANDCRQETARAILAVEKRKIDSLLARLIDIDEWECKDPKETGTLVEHKRRVPGGIARSRRLTRLDKDIVLLENGEVIDHGIDAVLRF